MYSLLSLTFWETYLTALFLEKDTYPLKYISNAVYFPLTVLLKMLMSSHMDGILEAIRVFGNLSQNHEICNFIIQRKGEFLSH